MSSVLLVSLVTPLLALQKTASHVPALTLTQTTSSPLPVRALEMEVTSVLPVSLATLASTVNVVLLDMLEIHRQERSVVQMMLQPHS